MRYRFRSEKVSVDVLVSHSVSVAETYFSDHPLNANAEPPNDIVRAVLKTNVPRTRWVEIDATPFRGDYALQSSDHKYVAVLTYRGPQPEGSVWTITVSRVGAGRLTSIYTPPPPSPNATPLVTPAAPTPTASTAPSGPDVFQKLSPIGSYVAVAALALALWALIILPLWRFFRRRSSSRKFPISISKSPARLAQRQQTAGQTGTQTIQKTYSVLSDLLRQARDDEERTRENKADGETPPS